MEKLIWLISASSYLVGLDKKFFNKRNFHTSVKYMLITLKHKQLRKTLILLISFFAFLPSVSYAATLYLESENVEYYQGDTFLMEIRIDTERESVNVAEIELMFPADVLEIKDISLGNSILSLWVEKPTFSNEEGRISFIGGIPGSYAGKKGTLAEVVFTVKKQGKESQTANFTFGNNSKLLLSDTRGTEVSLQTRGASLTIVAEQTLSSAQEWGEILKNDTTPPEPFRVEIASDPQIFSGEYFAVFSTTDKQSGVERYEVKEGAGEWQTAESPYLLKNQSSNKEVMVRAIDKAGNERIQMIQFETDEANNRMGWNHTFFSLSLFILLGAVLLRAGILYKRRKNISTL